MSCSDFQLQFGRFLDQELPAFEARRLSQHLKDCESCRRRFDRWREWIEGLSAAQTSGPPSELWSAIERRLPVPTVPKSRVRRWGFLWTGRFAASLVIAVGLCAAFLWPRMVEQRAEASSVQFRVLLDSVSSDPQQALRKFLVMYQGVEIRPAQAKLLAPSLNFELADPLPNGFRLVAVYSLRFGNNPGIVARYERGDELLIAIFHPPVHGEDFGTHRDYPCIIGKHRGHQVAVGGWRLVHVTDPTTCHCVLSRLEEQTELPAVLSAIAPKCAAAGYSSDQGPPHPAHGAP